MALPYRCAACTTSEPGAARCPTCRERRAAAARRGRAARVAAGTCTECSAPALPGQRCCERHRAANALRSGAAHAAAAARRSG